MRRIAPVLFLLVFAVPPAHAENRPGDPIPLAVSPAAAPKPSLKYRLYPDRRDLTPGNAAALYYRALASFVANPDLLKEIRQKYWSEWLKTPLRDLPMDEVREKLADARNLLHEIELASRCKDCDWRIEDRPEGIGLLPEVQGFRNVGTVLAVRARHEIAQGKWDDAARTLQTGYALAHHMGVGPTISHVLDGYAVARVMDEQVEAMIQQPGAPNLYWALTELPRPFLDPELSVEQESRMIDRMTPWVKRLDGPPMSEAEAQVTMTEMHKSFDAFLHIDFALARPSALENLPQAFFLVQGAGEARRGLLARGKYTAEQLDAMPSFQTVSLFSYLEYRDALDEMLKWVRAPHGLRHPGFQKASDKYDQALARIDRLFFRSIILDKRLPFGDALGASYRNIYEAAGRADRRIAALEYVEALRMYAARNGKWPAALEEVTDVPLPNDPVTGKPFDYRVQENKAVVAAPPVVVGKFDGPDAVSSEVFLRK